MLKCGFRYILALTLILMLTTWASALSSPYVNDYAEVLSDSAAELIEISSIYIQHELGVDIIVLTVHDLRGFSFEEFARRTLAGVSDIGDAYAMLLYSAQDDHAYIAASLAVPGIVAEYMREPLDNGNPGRAVLEGYKALARHVYDYFGAEPGEEMQKNLAPGNAGSGNFWYVIAAFGSILLFMRVYMINRKASRRYSGDRPYSHGTDKRYYSGDKEFDNIRVETIELDGGGTGGGTD